jgi:hypothetical protein
MNFKDFKTDTTHIYHDFENGKFFINSPNCILSRNQIIQTGMTYLFSPMPDKSGIKLLLAKLLNVQFDAGFVYLELMDILTGKIFEVRQVVRPGKEDCTWMLVDMDYFLLKIRKKKAGNHKRDESLLEFEF